MKVNKLKFVALFLALLMVFSLYTPSGQLSVSSFSSGSNLDVFYKLNSSGDKISYSFYLQNNTRDTIDLSNVKVRYWYTRNQPTQEQEAKFCTIDEWNDLVGLFITLPGYEYADTAFQLSLEKYTGAKLSPGEKSFVMDVDIWEKDRAFNQKNDYSIITTNNSTTQFIYNPKITVYNNNTLISGSEPNFASDPSSATTVYTEENFKGNSFSLQEGSYTLNNLTQLGITDNSIASIMVKPGYRVTLYENNNFSGKELVREQNDPSFINNNFHKITTSIRVQKLPITPILNEDPKDIPSGMLVDLGVRLSANDTKFTEDQEIVYTINYKNVTNVNTGPVTITAKIPEYTRLQNAGSGTQEGNKVVWRFSGLDPLSSGTLRYTVVVLPLNQPEKVVENTAEIQAPQDILQNPENASSSLKVLLYSKNQNGGKHSQYIVGYPDKEFKPSNNITRAEIATIMAKAARFYPELAPNGTVISYDTYSVGAQSLGNIFPDVKSTHWAAQFIQSSTQELKIFSGYPDGSFKPDKAITRAELATLVAKFLELPNIKPLTNNFPDTSTHWANNFIEEARRLRIINGYPDGTFKPDNNISRAEAVTMVNNMLYRGPLVVKNSSFPDVLPAHWAYGDIESSARTYTFLRTVDGKEVMKQDTSLYTLNKDGLAVLK